MSVHAKVLQDACRLNNNNKKIQNHEYLIFKYYPTVIVEFS